MIKKLALAPLILCLIILSGCIADADKRPQCNNEYVWVCNELEDSYFYWDENEEVFIGLLSHDEKTYDIAWLDSSGLAISIMPAKKYIEQEYVTSEDEILFGFADYQENYLTLEIQEDKLNIFNGEITTISFASQKWEDFLEEKNK